MAESNPQRPHLMIVGASSGIGFATAERFAGTYSVTALARRMDRLDALRGPNFKSVHCDVSNLDTIAPIVEQAVAERGKLSGLIYCAGLQSIKPMRSLKTKDIVDVVTVNLTAALVFAGLFASSRMTEGEAVFCGVSSIAGHRPEPAIVPYSVAKAGLNALIRGLARECGPRRAFGIAPGWLDTEMTQSFPQIYTETFRDDLVKKAPRGIATVEAVVDLIEFLMSDKAGHLTGQIITLDGGASL